MSIFGDTFKKVLKTAAVGGVVAMGAIAAKKIITDGSDEEHDGDGEYWEDSYIDTDCCLSCGARLEYNWFTEKYRCPECGAEYDSDDIIDSDDDEYESIYEDDDDDDIPEGCSACGGPYPNCTGCSLND